MDKKNRKHLSPHFILFEFTRSGTALDHNCANEPNLEQRKALTALCDHILEPLRGQFGPIVISSGFRSQEVNRLAGGVRNSQHLSGEAADIAVPSQQRLREYYNFISRNLDFDQLILEPNDNQPRWLHVSYTAKRKNRHQKVHL